MRRRLARLRVSVIDSRSRPSGTRGLAAWLTRIAPRAAVGEVAIALVSDQRMRRLNREFRGKDYATDVLSFPLGSAAVRSAGGSERALGDIVIATGVAARQAARLGHSLRDEFRVLALHGLLHLLGYDHEHDRGAMGRVERRLGARGGLRAGLIGRAV